MPTVVSRRVARPGPTAMSHRGCYLGCLFALLVPLVLFAGIAGGVAWAAWQNDRLNVLVLGLDRRPDEAVPVRSDTMILATFAPGQPQAALLSIPRDLWVEIPGHGANRINTANYFGDLDQAGYGPILAMQTVANNLGVPVRGYVRLDFRSFVTLIDTLGGVEVEVPASIVDDAYPTEDYGYMTIMIPAGRQHMDGTTALIYARTRHTGSDFDRSQRQQQIIRALVARTLQPATWPRLPAAWAVIRTSVETNLAEVDLATILLTSLLVGPDGLQSYSIDADLTSPFVTEGGAQVLLPNWEGILPMVHQVFSP